MTSDSDVPKNLDVKKYHSRKGLISSVKILLKIRKSGYGKHWYGRNMIVDECLFGNDVKYYTVMRRLFEGDWTEKTNFSYIMIDPTAICEFCLKVKSLEQSYMETWSYRQEEMMAEIPIIFEAGDKGGIRLQRMIGRE